MIIVDTNVISEALQAKARCHVLEWLDRQTPGSLFLTATVVSEAFYGVANCLMASARMCFGKTLRASLPAISRILSFRSTEPFRACYAKLVAAASRRGKTIQVSDGQIAAIALVKGFSRRYARRRSL